VVGWSGWVLARASWAGLDWVGLGDVKWIHLCGSSGSVTMTTGKLKKKVQRHCRVPGIFFKDNVTGRDIGLKNGTAVGHKGHPRGPDSPARQEF